MDIRAGIIAAVVLSFLGALAVIRATSESTGGRLTIVDVLRKHAGKVCVCELVPLFDISQPTLSHHLKKLRDAGIIGVGSSPCPPSFSRASASASTTGRWCSATATRRSTRACTAPTSSC